MAPVVGLGMKKADFPQYICFFYLIYLFSTDQTGVLIALLLYMGIYGSRVWRFTLDWNY
jgi:hypothetical protein